jgi:mitochondrial chaperone BCS1
MDVKVEYKKATTNQAAALFDRFFPSDRFSTPTSSSDPNSPSPSTAHTRFLPPGRSLLELRKAFAASVPEGEFTMAELQGYLMISKWDPERAVDGIGVWVETLRSERAERAAREEREKEKRRRARKAMLGNMTIMATPASPAVAASPVTTE